MKTTNRLNDMPTMSRHRLTVYIADLPYRKRITKMHNAKKLSKPAQNR
jgi:hypothetical protein